MKIGRPSLYTPELASEILERIGTGESLSEICRSEHMPSRETVNRWRNGDEAFCHRYAQAREASADAHADMALAVLDALTATSSAWEIRIADMKSRQFMYWARKHDPATYGKPKKEGKAPPDSQRTVGSIIDLIMGNSEPLVTEHLV